MITSQLVCYKEILKKAKRARSRKRKDKKIKWLGRQIALNAAEKAIGLLHGETWEKTVKWTSIYELAASPDGERLLKRKKVKRIERVWTYRICTLQEAQENKSGMTIVYGLIRKSDGTLEMRPYNRMVKHNSRACLYCIAKPKKESAPADPEKTFEKIVMKPVSKAATKAYRESITM